MSALVTAAARRLTAALGELKGKVRGAIAGETARTVGEAVRRAVALALAGRTPDDPPDRHPGPDSDPWDDSAETDPWGEPAGWAPDDAPPPRLPLAEFTGGRTRLAVAAGLAAGRWWLRRGTAAGAVGVGTLVALAVVCGGSAVQAAARALAAAADLAAVGRTLAPHTAD